MASSLPHLSLRACATLKWGVVLLSSLFLSLVPISHPKFSLWTVKPGVLSLELDSD